MPRIRPYRVTWNGIEHMVDAGNAAAAVAHVVRDEVTVAPAKTGEISAWARAGKDIEVAGVIDAKPDQVAGGEAIGEAEYASQADPSFNGSDAREWLIEKVGGLSGKCTEALGVFDAMRARGVMHRHDYDALRFLVPAFAEAIAFADDANPKTAEDIAKELENSEGIDFQDVVTAIGEAKRRELYVDHRPA